MSKLKLPSPKILFTKTLRTLERPPLGGALARSFAERLWKRIGLVGARSLKILCAVGFVSTTQSIWFLAPIQAQASGGQCATPGKDGVDRGAVSIVNTYYAGPNSDTTVNAGATTLPVGLINTAGSQTTITPGDLLLVIQMQDADINFSDTVNYGDGSGTGSGSTAINRSGLYEYVVATNSVGSGGGSISIRGTGTGGGLINSYRQEAASITSYGQRSYQVIRVPQFISTTLTGTLRSPGSWNGSSGGIVAIDVVNTLTLDGGTIESRDKGFRGGGGTTNTDTYPFQEDEAFRTDGDVPRAGSKGEGIAGTPLNVFNGSSITNTGVDGYPRLKSGDTYITSDGNVSGGSRGRGAPGNAGGGGNQHNSGGGGGGNAGVGGNGGNSIKLQGRSDDDPTTGVSKPVGGRGGSAFPVTPSRLIMGGGGGAGDANNGTAGSGGLGGGIVMIRAGTITGSGSISVSAFDGVVTPTDDGGSGAGAGGSILILAKSGSLAGITLNANGGRGGDTNTANPINYDFGPGGGGAGGSIFSSIPTGTTTVNGGLPGKSFNGQLGGTTGVTRGATAGTIGQVTSITTSSSQVPGIVSGSDCKAKVLLVKRITEVQGNRSQNPNDLGYRLDQVLDRPSFAADDPYPVNNWPNSTDFSLVGAYDAGRIKPGNTIEYTIYFLNNGGASARQFRICDRIVGAQTFLKDAYGIGQDIQYKLGTRPLRSLTRGLDVGTDRAQLDTLSTGAIAGCPASTITGTNNGTVIIDITGTGSSVQDNIGEIPAATAQGAADSYGYFRFKTQVIP